MPNNENFGANFSIDISELKKGLAQANRLIRESESEFKAAAAGMDDWTESQEGLEARIKHLNNATDIQRKKVEALQKEYEENVKKGIDPMSSSMVMLRTNINKEQAALAKNEKELRDQKEALEELESGAKDAANAVKKTGDSAKEAGDGFTVAKGAVANFIADGLSALVGAAKNAISSIANLAESTREYREDIGKLQTAFETAGLSTDLATQSYKELYSVLGEEDRSVEAVNHLAKFVKTEEDMAKWTNTLTGIWGTFGDSLPIEGLTEAANESIRTKTVTGVLADAINWAAEAGETFGVKLKANTEANEEWNKAVQDATTAEEYFNLALQECSTEQERQQLITETLNGLYSEAAKNYKENNSTIIESRKATSDYTDTMAELGAKAEPITTEVREGFNRLLQKVLELTDKADFAKLEKKIDKAFDTLIDDILPVTIDGFEWIVDNWRGIAAGFTGIFAVFLTNKLANSLITTHKAAKTLFATIKAFNSTNPLGLLVTGISLLGGGLAALAVATRTEKTATEESIKANKDFIDSMKDRQDAYYDVIEAAEATAAADLAELGQIEKLNEELSTLVDGKGKVKEKDEERVNFILNELNEAFGTEYKLIDGVVQGYKDLETQIDSVIEKKKAQILLEPLEAAYTEAIQNQAGAQKDLVQASKEHAEQLDVVAQKESELDALFDEVNEASKNHNYDLMSSIQLLIMDKERELEKEKELLAGREEAYSSAKSEMEEYFAAIEEYETAQGLVVSGKTEEAIDYMSKLSGAISEADKLVADSQVELVEKYGKAAEETRIYAEEMRKMYNEGVAGVTEDMVKTAEEAAATAQKEYERVGGGITTGIVAGIDASSWRIISRVNGIVSSAVESALAGIDGQVSARVQSSYDALNNPLIPKMAEGGIVNRATLAVIGEAGPEAVVPLRRSGHPMIHVKGEEDEKPKQPTVIVNQTNNYSQEKSRQEIYQTKVATKNIIKYALRGV